MFGGPPGFGFGFGGFDFPEFFNIPPLHRQFHGAFSSSSSSRARNPRERPVYGEGNEWKGEKRRRDYHKSVFGTNDDILHDIFSGGVIFFYSLGDEYRNIERGDTPDL